MNSFVGTAWALSLRVGPIFLRGFPACTRLDPPAPSGNTDVWALAECSVRPSSSGSSMGKSDQGQLHPAQA